jgi:hypothetical protein
MTWIIQAREHTNEPFTTVPATTTNSDCGGDRSEPHWLHADTSMVSPIRIDAI